MRTRSQRSAVSVSYLPVHTPTRIINTLNSLDIFHIVTADPGTAHYMRKIDSWDATYDDGYAMSENVIALTSLSLKVDCADRLPLSLGSEVSSIVSCFL